MNNLRGIIMLNLWGKELTASGWEGIILNSYNEKHLLSVF